MEQVFKEMTAQLDINLGFDNVLELTDLGIGIEALGDKIVVLLDSYRSGYECTKCKGIGKLRQFSRCKCDPVDWYEETHLPRGERNRFGELCELCGGDYMSKRLDLVVECPQCKGKGATLIIPQSAQSLPTTGVVVSVGPLATKIKKHCRIVASPYAGTYIPMKGNIPVKIYHQHEPLAYIYNINPEHIKLEEMIDKNKQLIDLPVSDFIELDTPIPDTQNI